MIVVLLAGNLRGVRQAGALFAAPTYSFILAMFVLVAVGLIDAAGRGFHPTPRPPLTATEAVGALLILRAFSSGSTAMTGIEAISNAVPVFKPVEWRNARTTLTWMVGLLIALFAGTIAMVQLDGIVPNAHETVLSQLAHRSFGSGVHVSGDAGGDGGDPAARREHRLQRLPARAVPAGARLPGARGSSCGWATASPSATASSCCRSRRRSSIVAFGGKTGPLIPLYAVGVFLAFTLSQSGMVVHWWRLRDPHWRRSLAFNATGGLLSAIVFITAAITKFTAGAWVSLVTVGRGHPARHRASAATTNWSARRSSCTRTRSRCPSTRSCQRRDGAARTSPMRGPRDARETREETEETPEEIHHLIIVAVASLDLASMRALAYAASLQQPVLALHVSPTERGGRALSAATGGRGVITCRSRSSSPPTARSSPRWSTTSSRCTACVPT